MLDEKTLREINTCPPAKSKAEERYIRKRKLKAWCNSLAFYICRIFPIDKKLVSVCTFEGKGGFGCNPKYIVKELHKQRPDVKFVWFVNKDIIDKKVFPEYVKKVPNTLWNRAYWLTRSKVWIDNYRKPFGTVKRKGQYYLNTNHYTVGIKSVGLWRGEGFSKMAYLVSKNDSDMIDDLIIDSKFCEEMIPKGLVYTGNLLKTGAPRCDILYGDRKYYKDKFKKKHGLPEEAKVIMFAPTFREGSKDGKRSVYSSEWSMDFKKLIINMEKKFGGEWYICVRVHPQIAPTFEAYEDKELKNRIINESQADDMYEIMAGMDVYITDYSSACFEAGYAGIPVFLYADDIDKYKKDRGSLFWDINSQNLRHINLNSQIFHKLKTELPFDFVVDNEQMEAGIFNFDFQRYQKRLNQFYSDIALQFDGNSSKEIVKKIESVIF